MIKTRIAPTPSGFLHPGNAYSFLTTQKIAHETGAKILLRIDDLDSERARPEYIEDIFDTLNFLQIDWDEGPRDAEELADKFSQNYRTPLYDLAINKLIETDSVFACNCSRSELERQPCNCLTKNLPLDTRNSALRVKTSDVHSAVMKIYGNEARAFTLPAEMANFVIRKKDGQAAYQLASVVDDLHFGVNLIVRGEDLLPSTIAQLFLAKKLESNIFGEALFVHHPLLKNAEGDKLSKTAGSDSILSHRKAGKGLQQLKTLIGITN